MIEFRQAMMADLDALFTIRNESSTYKFSLNPHEVSRNEHLLWLSTLIDQSSIHLVCVVENAVAGICYLSNSNSDCTFSIYVSEKYHKRGVGKQLLQQTLEEALSQECDRFLAEIHKDNLASIRLFESVGFQRTQQEVKLSEFILYEYWKSHCGQQF